MENNQLQPLQDQEVAQLRDDANGLLYKAEEVAAITELAHEQRAVEFLAQVKHRAKIVEEKRKSYTDPLNAVIKKIKADFDTITDPLSQAEVVVKKGIQTFRDAEAFREKERVRKEAEEKARAEINKIQNGDVSAATIEKAQEASAAVQAANVEAPRTVTTQTGQLRTRKDWKFEVLDAAAVPRELCTPDPKLIREAVKNGAREIAGVKIWEETVPIIMGGRY